MNVLLFWHVHPFSFTPTLIWKSLQQLPCWKNEMSVTMQRTAKKLLSSLELLSKSSSLSHLLAPPTPKILSQPPALSGHSPLCAAGPACGWWWPAGCRWRSRSGRWGWGPWKFSSWRSRAASARGLHRGRWCGGSGRSPPAEGHRAD